MISSQAPSGDPDILQAAISILPVSRPSIQASNYVSQI
jgi:hypothetical protein